MYNVYVTIDILADAILKQELSHIITFYLIKNAICLV